MSGMSVIVATCDRPRELSACLGSLAGQTRLAERVVVVDDAPGDGPTEAVASRWARSLPLRYVAGRRAGLAAAHNRGLREIATPLVAFTDDDVVAAPDWLERLGAAFADEPAAGCVTGLIRPLELAAPEQRWLEAYARYGKGSRRRVFDLGAHRPADPLFPFAAGTLGSGANMAFRTDVLREMGAFDPALGAGTRARGGDDLAAFFETIQRGHRLVYEPGAVVRHRHAHGYPALRQQVFGYGVGLTAYLTKALLERPALAAAAARGLPRALAHVLAPGSAKNAGRPADFPPGLARVELLGMLAGPWLYAASRRRVTAEAAS